MTTLGYEASIAACLAFASSVFHSTASAADICTSKDVLAPIVKAAHRIGTQHPASNTRDPRRVLSSSSSISIAFADVTWDFAGPVAQTLEMALQEVHERRMATAACVLLVAQEEVALIWFPSDVSKLLLYICPARVKVVKNLKELTKKLKEEVKSLNALDATFAIWTLLPKHQEEHQQQDQSNQPIEPDEAETQQAKEDEEMVKSKPKLRVIAPIERANEPKPSIFEFSQTPVIENQSEESEPVHHDEQEADTLLPEERSHPEEEDGHQLPPAYDSLPLHPPFIATRGISKSFAAMNDRLKCKESNAVPTWTSVDSEWRRDALINVSKPYEMNNLEACERPEAPQPSMESKKPIAIRPIAPSCPLQHSMFTFPLQQRDEIQEETNCLISDQESNEVIREPESSREEREEPTEVDHDTSSASLEEPPKPPANETKKPMKSIRTTYKSKLGARVWWELEYQTRLLEEQEQQMRSKGPNAPGTQVRGAPVRQPYRKPPKPVVENDTTVSTDMTSTKPASISPVKQHEPTKAAEFTKRSIQSVRITEKQQEIARSSLQLSPPPTSSQPSEATKKLSTPTNKPPTRPSAITPTKQQEPMKFSIHMVDKRETASARSSLRRSSTHQEESDQLCQSMDQQPSNKPTNRSTIQADCSQSVGFIKRSIQSVSIAEKEQEIARSSLRLSSPPPADPTSPLVDRSQPVKAQKKPKAFMNKTPTKPSSITPIKHQEPVDFMKRLSVRSAEKQETASLRRSPTHQKDEPDHLCQVIDQQPLTKPNNSSHLDRSQSLELTKGEKKPTTSMAWVIVEPQVSPPAIKPKQNNAPNSQQQSASTSQSSVLKDSQPKSWMESPASKSPVATKQPSNDQRITTKSSLRNEDEDDDELALKEWASTSFRHGALSTADTVPFNQQGRVPIRVKHDEPKTNPPVPTSTFIVLNDFQPMKKLKSPSNRQDRLQELRQKKLQQLQQQKQRKANEVESVAVAGAKKPSNRKLIQNAIEFTVLAGGSVERERTAALQAMTASSCDNFILLLKSAKELKFRGLYEFRSETDQKVVRIFALQPKKCPLELNCEQIGQFFKYNSAKKEFLPVDTRSFTMKTDACALVDQLVFKNPNNRLRHLL